MDQKLYGLHIRANRPIPGLVELPSSLSARDIDVTVTLDQVAFQDQPLPERQLCYVSSNQSAHDNLPPALRVWRVQGANRFQLLYRDETWFDVDFDSSRVIGGGPPDLSIENTATYLVGPVLGFFLRSLGVVCLHASVIAIDGRAIAFMGPAGGGKSSTAAAFVKRGNAALSDDVLALDERDGCFWVRPGYPRLNLWPNSTNYLFESNDLPLITPEEAEWDKRFLALNPSAGQFLDRPVPLAAIYTGEILPSTTQWTINPLSSSGSLLALLANSYTSYLLTQEMRGHEIDVLSRVARRIPIRRLRYRRDLDRLDSLCDAILADIETNIP